MSGRLKRNTMKNIRRHHIVRLKHKRKRDTMYASRFDNIGQHNTLSAQKILAIHVATPTICSCWMCGNPRKYGSGWEKLTIQERRHLQTWVEQLQDLAVKNDEIFLDCA